MSAGREWWKELDKEAQQYDTNLPEPEKPRDPRLAAPEVKEWWKEIKSERELRKAKKRDEKQQSLTEQTPEDSNDDDKRSKHIQRDEARHKWTQGSGETKRVIQYHSDQSWADLVGSGSSFSFGIDASQMAHPTRDASDGHESSQEESAGSVFDDAISDDDDDGNGGFTQHKSKGSMITSFASFASFADVNGFDNSGNTAAMKKKDESSSHRISARMGTGHGNGLITSQIAQRLRLKRRGGMPSDEVFEEVNRTHLMKWWSDHISGDQLMSEKLRKDAKKTRRTRKDNTRLLKKQLRGSFYSDKNSSKKGRLEWVAGRVEWRADDGRRMPLNMNEGIFSKQADSRDERMNDSGLLWQSYQRTHELSLTKLLERNVKATEPVSTE